MMLEPSIDSLLEKIESIGGKKVENENTLVFSLSDNQKQNAIFKALNPEKVLSHPDFGKMPYDCVIMPAGINHEPVSGKHYA